MREAREETSLDVQLRVLLGVYSNPARDPRGHTVTPVYIAEATGEPCAADDAKHLELYLPQYCPKLVFDHDLIIADYLHYLEHGQVAPLRIK
jgi:8-oxo-dGTP diphosphatase